MPTRTPIFFAAESADETDRFDPLRAITAIG